MNTLVNLFQVALSNINIAATKPTTSFSVACATKLDFLNVSSVGEIFVL